MRALVPAMTAAVALMAGPGAAPATAQAVDPHGLSVVFGVGYETGGWGPSIVTAFAEAGMDEEVSGICVGSFCDPPINYPVHYRAGIGAQFTAGVQYRWRRPVSLEVLGSNGVWGHAEGSRESPNEHLLLIYRPLLLTSTLGLHLGPVRVGAGPALNRTSWEYDYNHGRTGTQQTLTAGLAGSARFDLRLRDVTIAGRVDLRAFPDEEIRNPTDHTFTVDYRSLVVAVSLHPIGG